jgi:hypothetical protein
MQISRFTGWLFCATLFGALIGPMFFTSRVTHRPAIEVGNALYAMAGAAMCLLGAIVIQLVDNGCKCSKDRVIEFVICCVIVLLLGYNYFGARARLESGIKSSELKSPVSSRA